MKTLLRYACLAILVSIAASINSCSKNNNTEPGVSGTQTVSLYLTDAPGVLQNVYIDIRSVGVAIDTCKSHQDDFSEIDENEDQDCLFWSDLDMEPGVYDILELQNGVEKLLANGQVPKGNVKLIKIKLGDKNSVVSDGKTYPLKEAGNLSIVLRLKGNEWDRIENSHIRLWLDFDVFRSIINMNGEFKLKPFIHFFNENTRARIKGNVQPLEAIPVITIFNNADTAIAMPGMTGEFKIRGLKPGTYTVMIKSLNNYKDKIIQNVTIEAKKETDLGSITLKK
ncbi:MAG: DUF4382 domain-containing protein [Ilyomonas sp.]